MDYCLPCFLPKPSSRVSDGGLIVSFSPSTVVEISAFFFCFFFLAVFFALPDCFLFFFKPIHQEQLWSQVKEDWSWAWAWDGESHCDKSIFLRTQSKRYRCKTCGYKVGSWCIWVDRQTLISVIVEVEYSRAYRGSQIEGSKIQVWGLCQLSEMLRITEDFEALCGLPSPSQVYNDWTVSIDSYCWDDKANHGSNEDLS